MSDKTELSLQSLYDLIQTKADKTHTHTFIGSIESALSLQGVTYDKFVRNDLKNQKIKAYYDNVTFGISSLDTTITFKSEHNRATLEIFNENLSTHNLWVTGHNNEDVVISVNGKLLVNDAKVITVNDKGEITLKTSIKDDFTPSYTSILFSYNLSYFVFLPLAFSIGYFRAFLSSFLSVTSKRSTSNRKARLMI